MKTDEILNQVLAHIRLVRDDKEKLQKILDFILEEIYEEPDDEPLEIPDRFEKILKPIAQSIDAGFICFLNPKTLEIEEVPQELINDPYEFKMMTGSGLEDFQLKYKSWDEYYEFEPLESHESFRIMEAFAERQDDEKFKNQLIYALNNRKPFANFKWKVDNSKYRQDWFDFKQQWLEDRVRELIWIELNKLTDEE